MLIFVLLIIDDTTFYKLYKMKQELHSLELENIKKEKEIIQIKEKTKQLRIHSTMGKKKKHRFLEKTGMYFVNENI